MMKLLPYDSWSIESPLDVQTLVAGMTERIEPCKWFQGFSSSDRTSLQGTVSAAGFSASRIYYRNSFLPMLYGRFSPHQQGTTIRITMMLHPFVLAFLVVWFGMLGLFSIAGIAVLLESGSWDFLRHIGIMGGFAILLTYGAFFAEAGKAKKLISQVLLEIHLEATNKSVQSDEAVPPPLPRQAD